MCDHKPSQVFFLDGQAAQDQLLHHGPGILTDLVGGCDAAGAGATAGTIVTVIDGVDASGKPMARFTLPTPTATTGNSHPGMNLEFEKGLFVRITGPGPNFGSLTVGAYLQDDTPDPMAMQLERLRDEITKSNQRLYDFLQGLYKGDPAT